MPMPTVILDKNYLHSAPTIAVRELATTHSLLMPDVLAYEMVSADEPKRSKLLAKFQRLEVEVKLLKPMSHLLMTEMVTLRPCGRPSGHVELVPWDLCSAR